MARHLFDPTAVLGIVFWAVVVFAFASLATWLIRRTTRRIERGLSDVTMLRFVSGFLQCLAYLVGFVLYAHLVPQLRALGTALLAGASVMSVVVGLAAQDTLGNLIAGFSLVLSRTVQVGDGIRLYCPVGTIDARVRDISLAFTTLVDADGHEVVVPNSVMMSSAIVRLSPVAAPPPAQDAHAEH
ncbi:MAG: mechanosensitive ion channel family protein [Proteobacteria bacterium]|nr:mechanosensitive ion channel family protein [Pseudomonadota bacterium]